MKGKLALVTGSTSGIGLGIARSLAAEGCDIVLNGIGKAAELDALRASLAEEFSVEVWLELVDLTDVTAIESMMQSIEERGGADIVVNNAGIQHVDELESFPTTRWDAVIAINLSAAFHITRLALAGMRARGWGRIINIASAHGLVASPGKSAYVAAKHGLIGLTKVTALETAESAITCNAICPGWVETPLVVEQIAERAEDAGISVDESRRRLLDEKQPSGRFVTPEQLGGVVSFLCSEAADEMRGASLSVDGGWTAR